MENVPCFGSKDFSLKDCKYLDAVSCLSDKFNYGCNGKYYIPDMQIFIRDICTLWAYTRMLTSSFIAVPIHLVFDDVMISL
jgi:hypothetical protein